jgi:hypothetical protein
MRRIAVTSLVLALLAACASSPPGAAPAPRAVAIPAAPSDAGTSLVVQRNPMCSTVTIGFADPDPDPNAYSLDGTVAQPSSPAATCDMADSNVGSAAAGVLASSTPGAATASRPWDHKTTPAYMDLVTKRFHLTAEERKTLGRQGFVVPARFEQPTYAWAFHELYQSQVPLYVSVDAVMNAIYASNDQLIADIETTRVRPLLGQVLDTLHCGLADAAASYPPDVARDLDVYLTVARSLLADARVKSVLGTDDEAAPLIALAKEGTQFKELTLFGRVRSIDFSAYTPRGHYAGDLAPFFRAAMWTSRVELNLVSRSSRSSYFAMSPDPTETPREATVGLALADLAVRSKAMGGLDLLDQAWGLLAGRREDISIHELERLREKAGIAAIRVEDAPALRAVIGDGYKRHARIHPMAWAGPGEPELPVIATLLGPRIVPDTTATRPLVHDEVEHRYMVGDGDMAYALGHDRAKAFTADATSAEVQRGLDKARAIVDAPLASGDLYSAWFGAIRDLAKKPEGALPSFMSTPAFEDMRVGSTVAAFGQIRHNYVLVAGQGYDAAGCEIPDGWVDPLPEVYDQLGLYADRGAKVMAVLDPKDTLGTSAYFARLAKVLAVLRTISLDELAGRALTAEEKRFLSMVAEYEPPGSGGGPTYTGWYFDMFRKREAEGLARADFIADYYTSANLEEVAYAGATAPRLGFFVVDTGGGPRVVVGPVARGYVHTGPLSSRLGDEAARALKDVRDPWAASYTVAAPAEPPLAVREVDVRTDYAPGAYGRTTIEVTSTKALGPVTIEMLDHHRVPVASMTLAVGAKPVRFSFARHPIVNATEALSYEGLHVKVGTFDYVFVPRLGAMGPDAIQFQLGGMPAP